MDCSFKAFFDPLTTDMGRTEYVIGEFGIGLAVAGLVVAFLCWRRRGQLPAGGESVA
jgi:hypothetical protein